MKINKMTGLLAVILVCLYFSCISCRFISLSTLLNVRNLMSEPGLLNALWQSKTEGIGKAEL